jgi:hypothetical protein
VEPVPPRPTQRLLSTPKTRQKRSRAGRRESDPLLSRSDSVQYRRCRTGPSLGLFITSDGSRNLPPNTTCGGTFLFATPISGVSGTTSAPRACPPGAKRTCHPRSPAGYLRRRVAARSLCPVGPKLPAGARATAMAAPSLGEFGSNSQSRAIARSGCRLLDSGTPDRSTLNPPRRALAECRAHGASVAHALARPTSPAHQRPLASG